MKVETPRRWESPAPMRTRRASEAERRAREQGTKLPTWVMYRHRPAVRMKVLLPPERKHSKSID